MTMRTRGRPASSRIVTHMVAVIAAAFTALGGGLVIAGSPAMAEDDGGHGGIAICHATGADKYVAIAPSLQGVLSGHADHDDIVPEFWYRMNPTEVRYTAAEGFTHFPAMNWTSANQELYRNGCEHSEGGKPSASASMTCPTGLVVEVDNYSREATLEITLDGVKTTPDLVRGDYTYPSAPFTTGTHTALVRINDGKDWRTLLDTSVTCGSTSPVLFGASGQFCSPTGVVTTYTSPIVFATQAQADADLAARTAGLTKPVNGSCSVPPPVLYGASGEYCAPDGTLANYTVPATFATQTAADAALAALVTGLTAPVNGVCTTATPLPGTVTESPAVVTPLPATVITPQAATAGGGSTAPVAPAAAWLILLTGVLGLLGSGVRLLTQR